MKERKRLILDANILLRAVFGVRVRSLLEAYEDSAAFYTPEVCFSDARKYIPVIAASRQFDPAAGVRVLDKLAGLVQAVDLSLYEEHEVFARERMAPRDTFDWPVVATSLLLACPVWTEDKDFFGTGVSTLTTANVELYLREI